MSKQELIWLTTDSIITGHEKQIKRYGGVSGVKNLDLLESTIQNPQDVQYYDEDATVLDFAGVYLYALVKNHAFHDGNKRIGLFACDAFLDVNGYIMNIEYQDGVDFVKYVAASDGADKKAVMRKIVAWIEEKIKTS